MSLTQEEIDEIRAGNDGFGIIGTSYQARRSPTDAYAASEVPRMIYEGCPNCGADYRA